MASACTCKPMQDLIGSSRGTRQSQWQNVLHRAMQIPPRTLSVALGPPYLNRPSMQVTRRARSGMSQVGPGICCEKLMQHAHHAAERRHTASNPESRSRWSIEKPYSIPRTGTHPTERCCLKLMFLQPLCRTRNIIC